MEAVTDVVFRHVIAKAGRPDVFFTEFTNAASFCSPKGIHSTRGRLAFTEDEHPMVAQIWGSKPEHFREMAHGLKELGFKGIDINMGCPDKSVVKGGAGSALIKNHQLATELIAAAKEAGLPVSVKTRLGDVRPDEWRDWLTHLLKQDVVALTIHLRTRKEMSKVSAHFELIPDIKALRDEIAPQTLLIINGDIRDRQHGLELVEQYGVDGIMIGRGVFANPFAFAKVIGEGEDAGEAERENFFSSTLQPRHISMHAREMSGAKPRAEERSPAQLLSLFNLHLDLFDKYTKEIEPRSFDPLKRFFKIYVREIPGAAEVREKLMHTKSTDEVREIISSVLLTIEQKT